MNILIAVIVLALAGGFIAYLGDRIGSTVGKKRLTVLKLRPRDTARLFTVTSGALIALVTFLVLALIDRSFLVALQRGAELLQRNQTLQSENRKFKEQADQAQVQLESANAAVVKAKADLDQSTKQLANANSETSKAKSELNQVQALLQDKQANLMVVQNQARTLTIANAAAEVRLGKTAKGIQSKIQGNLIFRSEEEIGRYTVDAGQSVGITRQAIYSFLSDLSQIAKSSGGTGVQLVKVDLQTMVADERANVDALAESLHESKPGRVVVIANAVGNAYAGESVVVMLHPYADTLVLSSGEQLSQLTIPVQDSQNPTRVLSDLQGLLAIARSRALQAGVIPVANPQLKRAEIIDLKTAELYQVCDQVRLSNGPAIVAVTVSKDTYASDHPLQIVFTVNGNPVKSVY